MTHVNPLQSYILIARPPFFLHILIQFKLLNSIGVLILFSLFFLFQLYKIEREEVKKPSQVDKIFKQALREFKENLIATYSVANKQGNGQVLNIKYKDLIANFLHVRYCIFNFYT